MTYTVAMHYELWDTETANLVGEYDTEDEALDGVRRLLASGWDVEHLALGQEFDDEDLDVDGIGDENLLAPTVSGTVLAARATVQHSTAPSMHQRSA